MTDEFEPPKPKTAKQQAKQQAMRAKQKKTNKAKGRKRNKQQVSQKKKTTTKAPAVETVQEEGTTVKTTQESKEGEQQASPLNETEHSIARAHGGEISHSAKGAPGRTADNRLPPGPMQIGPHESFADEASGICQYAKSKEDCIFFPCNTHGSALAENWVDREQITAKCEELGEDEAENYGLDQITLKYGSGKRLMKINGETLFAVSQIPNEEAPCEAHAAIRCLLCLAILFVLDSASTIWVTNNVKNLLPSTVRKVSK